MYNEYHHVQRAISLQALELFFAHQGLTIDA